MNLLLPFCRFPFINKCRLLNLGPAFSFLSFIPFIAFSLFFHFPFSCGSGCCFPQISPCLARSCPNHSLIRAPFLSIPTPPKTVATRAFRALLLALLAGLPACVVPAYSCACWVPRLPGLYFSLCFFPFCFLFPPPLLPILVLSFTSSFSPSQHRRTSHPKFTQLNQAI